MFPVAGALALGGLAALDATPVAQTLLSQPLVTASLMGLMWGHMDLALQVGIVLQILAASTLPVGSRTPEDYATGGVIGVGVALALVGAQPYAVAHDACALLGVLVGMLAAMGGVPLLKWQRRQNETLGRWCESEIRSGNEASLGRAHFAAVILAFAVGVGYTAFGLGAGYWVLKPLLDRNWLRLSHAWNLAQPLWIGLGLAQILNAFVQRRLTRAALFALSLIGAWILFLVEAR